jgi:KUP system potassium uptake protein
VWFTTIAALGVHQIVQQPQVLTAVNPKFATAFFAENGYRGFVVLGSVFLVVTGGEALYADMGHFGKRPIRLSWFTMVLPALMLNYFGQGALLLSDPGAGGNPFFLMAPRWSLLPLVILSAMATVIASQAVISGAFSLTMQAVQFGYLPRLDIEHTSSREIGQIYIPSINWGLMVACIVLVLGFRSSSNLAAAYGVAVTTTMVVTTLLFFVVARERWRWSLATALLVSGFFLAVDASFWAANLLKIPRGGWFPLVVAGAVFVVMTTWKSGRLLLANRMAASSLPWDFFLADVAEAPPHRVPGTAIFMYGNPDGTPPALIYTLQHFRVLHEQVVVLRVDTEEVPHVRGEERIEVDALDEGFYRIGLRYGFMENPSVPEDLARISMDGLDLSPERTTYFLGRETVIAVRERVGMHLWRDRLFAYMARNARSATSYFRLPSTQVVELGAQIEI